MEDLSTLGVAVVPKGWDELDGMMSKVADTAGKTESATDSLVKKVDSIGKSAALAASQIGVFNQATEQQKTKVTGAAAAVEDFATKMQRNRDLMKGSAEDMANQTRYMEMIARNQQRAIENQRLAAEGIARNAQLGLDEAKAKEDASKRFWAVVEADQKRARDLANGVVDVGKQGERAMDGMFKMTAYARRELIQLGKEAITGDFSRMPATAMSVVSHMGLMKAATTPVGISVLAVAAAFGVLGGMAYHIETAERALNKLASEAEATGHSITNAHLEEIVKQLSLLPNVSKDAAEKMVGAFALTHNIGTEMFASLGSLSADFARALGIDGPAAAKKMADAFADPSHGVDMLEKALGTLTATQILHVKKLQEEGDLLGAQKLLYDIATGAISNQKDHLTTLQIAINDMGIAWNKSMHEMTNNSYVEDFRRFITWLVEKVTWLIGALPQVAHVAPLAVANMMGPFGGLYTAYTAFRGNPDEANPQRSASGKIGGTQQGGGQAPAGRSFEDMQKALFAQYEGFDHSKNSAEAYTKAIERLRASQDEYVARGGNDALVLKKYADLIDGAQKALEGLNKTHKEAKPHGDALSKMFEELKNQLLLTDDPLSKTNTEMQRYVKTLAAIDNLKAADIFGVMAPAIAAMLAQAEKLNPTFLDGARNVAEMNKAIEDFRKEGDKSVDAIQKQIDKQRAHNMELMFGKGATLDLAISELERQEAFATGIPGEEAGVELLQKRIAKLKELKALTDAGAALDTDASAAKKQLGSEGKYVTDMLRSVDSTAQRVWTDVLEGGSNAFKRLGQTLKASILDVIYQMTLRPFIIRGAVSLFGAMGVSGAEAAGNQLLGGQGGSGGGFGLSNIFSTGSAISGLWGGGGAGAFSSGLGNAFATSGMGQALGLSTSVSGMAGEAGATMLTSLGTTIGAAIPVIGAVVAIGMLVKSFLDSKKGGPKVGGAYSDVPGMNMYPGETNPESNALMAKAVTANTQSYNSLITQYGGKGTAKFGLSFDTDPQGTAQNRVSAGATVNGQSVYSVTDANAGRDQAELQARIELETKRSLLAALQHSELPPALTAAFNQVFVNTATSDQIDNVLNFADAWSKATKSFEAFDQSVGNLVGEELYAKIKEGIANAPAFTYDPSQTLTSDQQLTAMLKAHYDAAVGSLDESFVAMIDNFQGTNDQLQIFALGLVRVYATLQDTKGLIATFGETFTVADLENLKKGSESLVDTFDRVNAEFQVTNALALMLGVDVGKAFGSIGLSSEGARSHLIQLAGGIDALTTKMSYYLQNFYTPAQRAAMQAPGLNAAMAEHGLSGVTTIAQFNTAMSNALASGNSALVAFLLEIAPAFYEVTKAGDDAAQAARDLAVAMESATESYAQAVEKYTKTSDVTAATRQYDLAMANVKKYVSSTMTFDQALHLTAEQLAKLTPDQIGYITALINTGTALNNATEAAANLKKQLYDTFQTSLNRFRPEPTLYSLTYDAATAQQNMSNATGGKIKNMRDVLGITPEMWATFTETQQTAINTFVTATGALQDFNKELAKTAKIMSDAQTSIHDTVGTDANALAMQGFDSTQQTALRLGSDLTKLSGTFDGTAAWGTKLATATTAWKNSLVAAYAAIENVRRSLQSTTDSARETIAFGGTKSGEEKYALNDKLYRATMEKVKLATDPAEIQRLTQQATGYLMAGWNSLSPEQQDSASSQYLKQLDAIDAAWQKQLQAAKDQLDENARRIGQIVSDAIDGAATKMENAGNAMIAAATVLARAAGTAPPATGQPAVRTRTPEVSTGPNVRGTQPPQPPRGP